MDQDKKFNNFYEKLKSSVNVEYVVSSKYMFNLANVNNSSKQELMDQIVQKNNVVDDYKHKGIKHYVEFGYLLGRLKICYYNKCSNHNSSEDLFKILACKQCKYNFDSKEFFSDMKRLVGYERSTIDHYIRVAALGTKSPKFQLCSVTVSEIKPYMKQLKIQMKNDVHIWT